LSLRSLLVLLPCIALLGACAGRQAAFETGSAECSDGQDNDDDGKIDCLDTDCQYLAFCSPTDAGPKDGPPPTADHGPTPDVLPPKPDLPPSQYGRRCNYTGTVEPCADKQTVCVYGKYSTPGYCTYPCIQGQPCPDGPPGTQSHCGYDMSGQWYCIFLCMQTPCPHDTICHQTYYGEFCF
jgi:hypothetical protein